MGRESEHTDPLLRRGFGQRLPGRQGEIDGASTEILLEPTLGKKTTDSDLSLRQYCNSGNKEVNYC